MLRVLIVEDDRDQAEALKMHLQRYAAYAGIEFNVTWHASALEAIERKQEFDLIFLDIRLPGIDGMEAARILRSQSFKTPIIFVTDLAQYAIEGYQVDALDFMVKPVSYHDFQVRMDRALRIISQSKGNSVFVRMKDGVRVVPSNDIVFIEVFDHNLVYHLVGGETLSHRGKLGDLETELVGSTFTRISSSCLANMAHIRSISGTEVLMSSGEVCFITRTRRKAALEAIANYYGGNL